MPVVPAESRRPVLSGQAHLKYHFKNQEAVIIGDSYRADMQCADNAGILGIHVATGRGSAGRQDVVGNDVECADLAAAAALGFFGTINRKKRRRVGNDQHWRIQAATPNSDFAAIKQILTIRLGKWLTGI